MIASPARGGLEKPHGGRRGSYETDYSPKRGRAAVPGGVPPTKTPRTPGTRLFCGQKAPMLFRPPRPSAVGHLNSRQSPLRGSSFPSTRCSSVTGYFNASDHLHFFQASASGRDMSWDSEFVKNMP